MGSQDVAVPENIPKLFRVTLPWINRKKSPTQKNEAFLVPPPPPKSLTIYHHPLWEKIVIIRDDDYFVWLLKFLSFFGGG